jgi:hypothetical protein
VSKAQPFLSIQALEASQVSGTTVRVVLANSTYRTHVSDASFCTSWAPGDAQTAYHPWPSPIRIAGDGYAYASYVTWETDITVHRAAAQPYADAVYDAFDHILANMPTYCGSGGAATALAEKKLRPEPMMIKHQGPDAVHNVWYWIDHQWRR